MGLKQLKKLNLINHLDETPGVKTAIQDNLTPHPAICASNICPG